MARAAMQGFMREGGGRGFPGGMPPMPGMPPGPPNQMRASAPMLRGPPPKFDFGRVVDTSNLKERGFAFISPEDGGDNLFFHIHWYIFIN